MDIDNKIKQKLFRKNPFNMVGNTLTFGMGFFSLVFKENIWLFVDKKMLSNYNENKICQNINIQKNINFKFDIEYQFIPYTWISAVISTCIVKIYRINFSFKKLLKKIFLFNIKWVRKYILMVWNKL